METQRDLFCHETPASMDAIASPEGFNSNKLTGQVFADSEIRDVIADYIHSFDQIKDEIEAKGRLIDFIRSV